VKKKPNGILIWTACALGLALTTHVAAAATIASYTAGMDPPSNSFEWGESFTTPGGGPWNGLQFIFYADAPPTTPDAGGIAYLLSSEYLGTPGNLSSSTPGFIAQSTGISANMYVFNPSVTLNANTEYWVYETAALNITGTSVGAGTPGEHAYGSNGNNFVSLPAAVANFTLSGSLAPAVPEPSTIALMGIALVAGVLSRKLSR